MPTQTENQLKPNFVTIVFVLAFLFLGMRFTVLLTSVDFVYQGEELHRGTVAKEIVSGLALDHDLSKYRPDPYSGGSLVVSLVAAFFYMFLGPNLLTLKLVSLTFSFLIFLLSLFFLNRFFSRSAAIYTGLLLLFAPSGFVGLSLIGNGDHAESILVSLLSLILFYECIFKGNRLPLAGFAIGFLWAIAFWFIPSTLVATLSMIVCWWWLDRKTLIGTMGLSAFCGVCSGLIPWFLFNISNNFGGLDILESTLETSFDIKKLAVFYEFPIGLFAGTFPKIQNVLMAMTFGLIGFSIFMIDKRSGKEDHKDERAFFVIFPLIYLLAASASSYDFSRMDHFYNSYRFLMPLYFFLLLFLGVVLSQIRKPIIFLVPLLVLGGLSQASIVFNEPFGLAGRLKGYSYYDLGEFWAETYSESGNVLSKGRIEGALNGEDSRFFQMGYFTSFPPANLSYIENLNESDRVPFLEAFGYSSWENNTHANDDVVSFLKSLSSGNRSAFYRGYAMGVVTHADQEMDMPKALTLDQEYTNHFWFELGSMHYAWHHRRFDKVSKEVMRKISQTWYWRGVGKAAAFVCLYDIPPAMDKCLRSIQPEGAEFMEEVYWGIGWGIREDWMEDAYRARMILERFPAEIQPLAREGFRACEKWYGYTTGL